MTLRTLVLCVSLCVGALACTTPGATRAESTCALGAQDPWTAATAWAADLDAARAVDGAAPALDGWERAHVLRVWSKGDSWRAIVAPKPEADTGPAALLHIEADGELFVVRRVEPASPTDLWPAL